MKAKDLRNSILQMAVQGKLVPQDPNDEPASVLVERIRKERAKLIKEKKIRAPKGGESVIWRASDGSHYEKRVDARGRESEPVCIDNEIPFEVPKGWAWCRFSLLAGFLNGDRSKNYPNRNEYVPEGIAWINTGHITPNGHLDVATMNYITREKFNSLSGGSIQPGDLVFCLRGATFGKVARVEPFAQGAIASSLMIIRLVDLRMREYVFTYLRSPLAYDELRKYDNGSAQPNLAAKDVARYLIPVPPIGEQRRIVGIVGELSPVVDTYGALEDARERLDAELPGRLRKSVLQLAVQGKLAPQDPTDEPASVLLERIRAERARLFKEKKVRAPKGGESVIWRASDGGHYEKRGKGEPRPIEVPFEIPDSWEWARVSSVFNLVRGSGIKRTEVAASGEPCVRYGELYTTYHTEISDVVSHTTRDVFDKAQKLLNGEVVSTLTGENDIDIGRSVVNNSGETIAFGGDLLALKGNYIDGEFAMLCMNSPYMGLQRTAAASGNIIVHLSADKIGSFLMAVPPADEQKRIVARCKELLATIG